MPTLSAIAALTVALAWAERTGKFIDAGTPARRLDLLDPAAPIPATGNARNYRRRIGIFVGIDRYPRESGLAVLGNAVNDARAANEFLVNEFGYDRSIVLLDQDASLEKVRSALDEPAPNGTILGAEDAFLFFFAGHGLDRQDTGGGLLALADSRAADATTCLSVDELRRRLAALPCRHKLILLDCCYSGTLFRKRTGTAAVNGIAPISDPPAVGERWPGRGRGLDLKDGLERRRSNSLLVDALGGTAFVGLSAGRATPVADGVGAERHSLFTAALLQVLRERADSLQPDHSFTFSQLAVLVTDRVANAAGSRQTPDWGWLDEGTGDYVFAPTKRRATPRELSEERRQTAHRRLIRLYLENGWRASAEGRELDSLPWFAQALLEDGGDSGRAAVHHRRLSLALRRIPRLEHVLPFDTPPSRIEFAPASDKLLVAGADGRARMFKTRDYDEPPLVLEHGPMLAGASFGPAGKQIVTWSGGHEQGQGGVRIWDAQTGTPNGGLLLPAMPIRFARLTEEPAHLVINGRNYGFTRQVDGRWVAGDVHTPPALFDVAGGKQLLNAEPDEVFDGVSSNQSGRGMLVLGRHVSTGRGFVRPLDPRTGERIGKDQEFPGHVGYAMATDDGTLAFAIVEGKVHGWNLASGQALGEPFGEEAKAILVRCGAQNKRLVTVHERQIGWSEGEVTRPAYARIWDLETGEPVGDALSMEGDVEDAFFDASGRLIVLRGAREARMFRSETGDPTNGVFRISAGMRGIALSDDLRHFAAIGNDGRVRIWAPPISDMSWTSAPELVDGDALMVGERALEYAPDGKTILVVSGWKPIQLDAETGERLAPLDCPDTIGFAHGTRDGRRIIGAGGYNSRALTLATWDVATASLAAPIRAFEPSSGIGTVVDLTIDPMGRWALTAHRDGTCALWSLDDLSRQPRVMQPADELFDADIRPDGEGFALAGVKDGEFLAIVCDSKEGTIIATLPHEAPIARVLFHPEGGLLASAGGEEWGSRGDRVGTSGFARLWDLETQAGIGAPMKHDGRVEQIAFSPDGRRLATGSADRSARLWSVPDGTPLAPPMIHDAEVVDLRMDSSGRFLATACGDPPPKWSPGQVRIWDAETGEPVSRAWSMHQGASAATLAPDALRFAAAGVSGHDGVIVRDIGPDWRSASVLASLAQATADAAIDDTGGAVPLTNEQFQRIWDSARKQSPP